MSLRRILIANRGEIACRIIKTAKKMGIESVVAYSEADKNSLAVQQADFSICIGEAKPNLSYLNIQNIIEKAKQIQVDAIHPGYGFLSENPNFASACEQANIIFIGPSTQAISAMASKQLAKQNLRNTSVPLTPGYEGTDQSDANLLAEAQKIGFPVLLKAALGGGGKGMRVVTKPSEFQLALESARREAQAYFGNDTLIIEKLIQPARHIEIQILRDQHGHGIYLFERDCSLQRRHQKIIEEAPAHGLSSALREQMGQAALAVAEAINYTNAGTIEFLLDPQNQFYFMEMNTRLQVEHPVTEMITGIDLVEWQIRIAAGEKLSITQANLTQQGHAIEWRIYAEDPTSQLPSSGTIEYFSPPMGEGIRLDTGVTLGSPVSTYYDSMISKLIIRGNNRDEAIQKSRHALQNFYISGIKTNLPFLNQLVNHIDFIKNKTDTHFIESHQWLLPNPDLQELLYIAASIDFLRIIPTDPLEQDTFAWQPFLQRQWCYTYLYLEQAYHITIIPQGLGQWQLDNVTCTGQLYPNRISLEINGVQNHYRYTCSNTNPCDLTIFTKNGPMCLLRIPHPSFQDNFFENNANSKHLTSNQTGLCAPMPSNIVAILKQAGETVKAGETIMILEAMKMEHAIQAPSNGKINKLLCSLGTQVSEGTLLVDFESTME